MVYKNLLHSFNMAHLDIRVDNICVNSNSDLVLIDLDRSVNNPERKAYNFNHIYVSEQTILCGSRLEFSPSRLVANWIPPDGSISSSNSRSFPSKTPE